MDILLNITKHLNNIVYIIVFLFILFGILGYYNIINLDHPIS